MDMDMNLFSRGVEGGRGHCGVCWKRREITLDSASKWSYYLGCVVIKARRKFKRTISFSRGQDYAMIANIGGIIHWTLFHQVGINPG